MPAPLRLVVSNGLCLPRVARRGEALPPTFGPRPAPWYLWSHVSDAKAQERPDAAGPRQAPEAGGGGREAISFRFPPGTKARIRRAMALLMLASPTDAPTEMTAYVMAAIEEKIARDSARKPAK